MFYLYPLIILSSNYATFAPLIDTFREVISSIENQQFPIFHKKEEP